MDVDIANVLNLALLGQRGADVSAVYMKNKIGYSDDYNNLSLLQITSSSKSADVLYLR